MIAMRRREGGEAAGRGGNRAAARLGRKAAGGRRKEGGRGEADRWAPAVSVSVEKEKKERGKVGRRGRQAGGPPGLLGLKEAGAVFFFSLFFFKLHFQIIFHLKFNSNFFKLFSRIL
jgi:hypothetical protein